MSAPAITVPDVMQFKNDRSNNASNFFAAQMEKLNREYQELLALANDTELVYNARYNFIPKVGQVYHLYWTGEDHLLSLIENWKQFDYIGSYRFTVDNIWEKV